MKRHDDTGRDPYWTRHPTEGGSCARREPTLWAASVAEAEQRGPLGAAELRTFAERGCLALDSVVPRRAVEALGREVAALAASRAPTVIREAGSDAVRSVFAIHRTGPFATFAQHPRVRAIARQILGSAVYVHQSRINLKAGSEGRAFAWHSDFETWHAEDGMPRMRALSVALALTDHTLANGPLRWVPGSHLTFLRCVGRTPAAHHRQSLRQQRRGLPARSAVRALIGEGGVQRALGPAGSLFLFDCNLLHGSGPNGSTEPRHTAFIVFNSQRNRLRAPFGGTRPRPRFLADRA